MSICIIEKGNITLTKLINIHYKILIKKVIIYIFLFKIGYYI